MAASGDGVCPAQDHLQRAGAIQADLPGTVDDAHPAAAQLTQDLIAGDRRGGAGRRFQKRADAPGVAGVGHHTDRRVGPARGIDARTWRTDSRYRHHRDS